MNIIENNVIMNNFGYIAFFPLRDGILGPKIRTSFAF